MAGSNNFLPIFDIAKIESYFFFDYSSITAFFKITSENLGDDLDKIANAFSNNDMMALKHSVHTIKPIFGITGLPAIQQEVDNFYTLCKQGLPIEGLLNPYRKLWPLLQEAKEMITLQYHIFQQNTP
jgi:Hpt domain